VEGRKWLVHQHLVELASLAAVMVGCGVPEQDALGDDDDPDVESAGIAQALEVSWVECSKEWQRCTFTGTRNVRYGANGTYAAVRSFSNGVDCRNQSFGSDPVPGITKTCWLEATSTAPSPSPAPTPAPTNGVLPYSSANPIFYTNDHPEDAHTDVIVMALASNGRINLRGFATDQQASAPGGCGGDGCHTQAIDDAKRREWIQAARQSGFKNVPDSVVGNDAVERLLAEARAASSSRPLVIMVGGPLSLVAQAYRRDPSMASRVIVVFAGFQSTGGRARAENNVHVDRAAAQLVLEKLRCVVVPFVDWGTVDQSRFALTPRSRVDQLPNKPLRGRMQSIYAYPWAHMDIDGGPVATLLASHYASASKRVRWSSDGGGQLVDDNASDDLLITQVQGSAVTEPWWREVRQAFGAQ
jgi:hypothetical protein